MEADSGTTKQCTRCTLEQKVEKFRFKTAKNKNGTVRRWRYSWCNSCCSKLALEYYHGLRPKSVREIRREPLPIAKPKVKISIAERRRRGAYRAKKWRAAHHEQVIEEAKIRGHLRRARLKDCEGTFSTREWRGLQACYQHRCLSCGARRGDIGVKITIDHIVPVVDKGTNWIWNIQPLCSTCNSSKGANTLDYRTDGFYMRTISSDGTITDLGSNFFIA